MKLQITKSGRACKPEEKALAQSLSHAEASQLAANEGIIREGLTTFFAVGNALLEIRDRRLYRAEFGTFESYCRERWNINRDYANKLIGSAKVVANLDTIESKPTREAQVRPLTKLPPEQQKEAWRAAVETSGGDPTAKHVQAAVEALTEPHEQPTAEAPAPANALQFAELALYQLRRIRADDIHREQAAETLSRWIAANLAETPKYELPATVDVLQALKDLWTEASGLERQAFVLFFADDTVTTSEGRPYGLINAEVAIAALRKTGPRDPERWAGMALVQKWIKAHSRRHGE